MPPWWGKSSSKEVKTKANRGSIIDTINRKFRIASDEKFSSRSGGVRKYCSDAVSEKGSRSRAVSRSPSPSMKASRCQSFSERAHAQPLPLPGVRITGMCLVDSENASTKQSVAKGSNPSVFLPPPTPSHALNGAENIDVDGDLAIASIFSNSSTDSEDPSDSRLLSPLAFDYENGNGTARNSPKSLKHKDHFSVANQKNSREMLRPAHILSSNRTVSTSPKQGLLSSNVPNLQTPDSSLSSPSRSPMRVFGHETFINSGFWAGKPGPDIALLGSGHCSSPGSGHNSGHNSVGGDMSGQLFWQHSRWSPECSPNPSPRMTSPGPSSRIQSGAVTPLHPRAGGAALESPTNRPDDQKPQSHRLPLPPITISNQGPFGPSYSAGTTPVVPRSPGRTENPPSPGSRWKKGRLLGRGTFGHVYLGFNSESGEMCAMKEVTLFSDDIKSKESVHQLGQEIATLSRLRHPNIVQYYGSETVDDKLYIYLEFVSGGSIYKILQEYGRLGEVAIRSYTQQILLGLAYLHTKNTVHRDIKGANILVDPNGRVKLADFGMAKHITGQSCPLSFKGSPYWMAPEVFYNSNGSNLAVDIWSLGCTVLEMATTKPPWSQYEGVAAMFKIGNSKELPAIPDHLSDDGKDFVRQCLQRNPLHRPTAAQLLDHPFVKNTIPMERPIPSPEPLKATPAITNGFRSLATGHVKDSLGVDSEGVSFHQLKGHKTVSGLSDAQMPRNISCPVSPIGSPLLHSRSPLNLSGRLSPPPIFIPRAASGSSTPLASGSDAIPFHHPKQSTSYLQEAVGTIPKSPKSLFPNCSTSYQDPKGDMLWGSPQSSHLFQERVPSGNIFLGDQSGHRLFAEPRELYDGQSELADRVSQRLLRDHVKSKQLLDLNPRTSMRGRINLNAWSQ